MKKYVISLIQVVFICSYGFGQLSKTTLKTNLTGVNYSTLQMSDLITGQFKNSSFGQRFGILGKLKNRYKSLPVVNSSQKQGEGKNGLKYYVSRNPLLLPASSTGSTTTRSDAQDNLICEFNPVKTAVNFTEALFLGGKYNFNTAYIYPGALLRDDDVVKGIFNPVTTLNRVPGSIHVNVLSADNNIQENVSDFDDRGIVQNSINTLLAKKVGSSIPVPISDQFSFEIRSFDEFSLKANASMDVNLAALLEGLPVSVGAEQGASAKLTVDFNAAVASIQNVYYTISLSGDGPASTVNGTVPSNLLCVTDVAYGSVAYVIVMGAKTRFDAALTASRLLEISEIAGANAALSAEVVKLLEGKIARIHVYGGVSPSSTATITDLSSLRAAMAKMKPTVLGIGALPLFYNLRYASDNSPSYIGAFAEFSDNRCFKADQLKIDILESKLISAAELDGTEELFGNIRVDCNGNSTIDDRDFWTKSKANAISKTTGQNITMDNESITFNMNPQKVNFNTEIIKFTINIKDRIEGGPEYLGTTDAGRKNGFVQYGPTEKNIPLSEIKESPNGTLTKTYSVEEGSSTFRVKVKFTLK